jgi:hypothetical protein
MAGLAMISTYLNNEHVCASTAVSSVEHSLNAKAIAQFPVLVLGLQQISVTDSTVKHHTKKNHSGFTSPCKQNQVLSVFTIA